MSCSHYTRCLVICVISLSALAILLMPSCGGGGGGDVIIRKTFEQAEQNDLPPDDQLTEKNPEYSDFMVLKRGSWFMNSSDAVIKLDLDEADNEYQKGLLDQLYPNFRAVLDNNSVSHDVIPSIDMLDRYTKSTDDSVYAAIELEFHDHDAVYPGGKQGFLSDLLAAILDLPSATPGRDLAAALIGDSIELGGGASGLTGSPATLMQEIDDRFMAIEGLSKPLGFYTESEILKQVFRRDRLLQQPFGINPALFVISGKPLDEELNAMVAIATVLDGQPEMYDAYVKYLSALERMTNPTANLDLRDLLKYKDDFGNPGALRTTLKNSPEWQYKVLDRNASNEQEAGVAIWPFSYSKEGVLMSEVPPDQVGTTHFMDLFVDAIRTGEVDLAPVADSGWYDFQVYALETFLLPERGVEADNLLLTGIYKKRLRNAFEALVTQRRETHIKQLQPAGNLAVSEPPPPPTPEFSIEPAITHFLRTARAYQALNDGMAEAIGVDAYAGLSFTGGGSIKDAVQEAAATFYGLHFIACNEVGVVPPMEPDELSWLEISLPEVSLEDGLPYCPSATDPALSDTEAIARLGAWDQATGMLDTLQANDCLDADPRVIVPVHYDPVTKSWRCWAVIGVKLVKFSAEYARPPRAVSVYGNGGFLTLEEAREALLAGDGLLTPGWTEFECYLPVYEFAEVAIGETPLTREEFRALCDREGSREAIIAALKALP